MSRLNLSFLGQPQIRIDEKSIKLETNRALALLAYLAVEQKAIRRDALVLLLWPDLDQSQGRTLLRQTLYSLKKSLSEDWFASDRESIAIQDDGNLYIDVHHFHKLLSSCKTHGHSDADKCAECQAPLTEAVSLYRDDFLSGFVLKDSVNFDDWEVMQAESLGREYETALQSLIRCLSDQEDYSQAIAHARDLLALDRLNENSHRILMQLFAWAGDRTAALKQYQECVRVLKDELDTEPLEETTKFYEDIKAGNVASCSSTHNNPFAVQEKQGEPFQSVLAQESIIADKKIPSDELASLKAESASSRPRHNLPAQTTPLIGREREIAQVTELLLKSEVRLVTLTGAGGTGKTRLALQVAEDVIEEFEDGVIYVSLESIKNIDFVASAIGSCLGLREAGDQAIAELVKNYLREKRMLLVLDNFEQVISAAGYASHLLAACAELKVLITSREVLHLHGEHGFTVPPLSLPDLTSYVYSEQKLAAELAQNEAVSLFTERARAIQPDFVLNAENAPSIAEICQRLDGLPLAIELAAPCIRLFTPNKLLKRLEKRLPLLIMGDRDHPARQQTLRAGIDWSYDLLGDNERVLFRRLAVFAGGSTYESAESICGTLHDVQCDVFSGLASLEEKSLAKPIVFEGDTRFYMLETIREYAEERLSESDEAEIVRRRHAEYFYALASEAEPKLRGMEASVWMSRMERELNNFRAALEWSIENDSDELGLKLAGALCPFWESGREALNWLEKAIGASDNKPSTQLAFVISIFGSLLYNRDDTDRGISLMERGLSLSREIGDAKGIAHSLFTIGTWTSGFDYQKGAAYLEECVHIYRELGDKIATGNALCWLAGSALRDDDHEKAQELLEEAINLSEEGGDLSTVARIHMYLSEIAERRGKLTRATALQEESLAMFRRISNKGGIADTLPRLAGLVAKQGKHEKAKILLAEATQLFIKTGTRWGIVSCLLNFSIMAIGKGQIDRATRLIGATRKVLPFEKRYGPKMGEFFLNVVDAIRELMGKCRFESAWQEGLAMSQDEAIKYAFEDEE